MDSERRHELETNELREFLDNFKDFWDKHGNKLLLTLIVVLGSYAGYNYYNSWKTGKVEEAQKALAEATSVEVLIKVAGEHCLVHDEAMRRAGALSLADARAGLIDDSSASTEKALKQAGSAYTALADRGKTVEFKLIGHEGLAKVAVMSGQWDKAKAQYQQMIELAGQAHPAQAARAKAGLDSLDLLKQPMVFGPDDDLSFNPDNQPAGSGEKPAAGEDQGSTGTGETGQTSDPAPAVPEIKLPDPLNPGG